MGFPSPGAMTERFCNTPMEKISAEWFSAKLKEIKADKGLSWAEMAELCGRSRGALAHHVYGNREWVGKGTAEDILKRLSGASLPPTPRQQAEYTVKARKEQADQRAETLRDNKLQDRKAAVAKLRISLG